jgi:hypothetical protein
VKRISKETILGWRKYSHEYIIPTHYKRKENSMKNIQEYINGLVNKQRTYYLDLNNFVKRQDHSCSVCHQKANFNCGNCSNTGKQLTGEITNLNEFANLKGVNASNNQITSLNFLNSLPNKGKLKGINLFGNQVREVDFADLFIKFPNLEGINLQNNPLSAKNLDKLSKEQFAKLVQGIKEKKIKIHSFKGTISMDLLDYARKLAANGNHNAYQLQEIIQGKEPNNNDESNKAPFLVGGLVIFGISALVIGYL